MGFIILLFNFFILLNMSYIPQEEKEMIAKIVSKLKECNMSLINYSTSGALRILSDCVMSKPLCKIFIKYEKEIKSLIKNSHTVVEVATGEPVRACGN